MSNIEEIKLIAESLKLLLEIKERFPDYTDDKDESTNPQLQAIKSDVLAMYNWAYGTLQGCNIKIAQKQWKEHHPDLPELYFPENPSESRANMFQLYQILPHWLKHKEKLNKTA